MGWSHEMRRQISIILGLAAYLAPALWLWWQYRQAGAMPATCGLWQLFAFFWGAVLAMLLSGASMWHAIAAWRGLPKPRPLSRLAEIAACLLPGVAGLTMIWLLICA
jgi:hypothetical protein